MLLAAELQRECATAVAAAKRQQRARVRTRAESKGSTVSTGSKDPILDSIMKLVESYKQRGEHDIC